MALVSLQLLSVCLSDNLSLYLLPGPDSGQPFLCSLVRDYYGGSDSVQCHTDLSTCCSGAQGAHR